MTGTVALRAHAPAVKFYQMPDDREAKTQSTVSACRGTIGLPETLKDVRQKLRSNAWTCVTNFDLHICLVLTNTDADNAARESKLRSIRQQVPNNLLEAVNVAGNPWTRTLAMMHVSMSDAVNAAQDRYARFTPEIATDPNASA